MRCQRVQPWTDHREEKTVPGSAQSGSCVPWTPFSASLSPHSLSSFKWSETQFNIRIFFFWGGGSVFSPQGQFRGFDGCEHLHFCPEKQASKNGWMDGWIDKLLVDFCKLAASLLSTQSQSCILGSLCTGAMCEVKSAKSYVDEERHVTAKSCAAESDAKTEKEGRRRAACCLVGSSHPGNSTHRVNKNTFYFHKEQHHSRYATVMGGMCHSILRNILLLK